MGSGWMSSHGFTTEPPAVSRVDDAQWVDKGRFIAAVIGLIPEARRQAVAADWRTLAAIAQLPGDGVNLADARVNTFLDLAGIEVEALSAALENEAAL